jgi:hypothetical protein
MQNKAFEWLRAANLKPDNQAVELRQRIVADALAYLDAEADARLLVEFVTAACAGCKDRFAPDAPFITKLVEITRKHQAAFPADLAENGLDLQVTCAIVIGELLTRSKKSSPSMTAAAASLVVSTLGLRSSASGKYTLEFLSDLLIASRQYLDKRSASVRMREEPDVDELEAVVAPADATEFWKLLAPKLSSVLSSLNENAKADREELEVLWWFYNRHSKRLSKPIADLSLGQAALVTAIEVADCVILPPHGGVITMINEAIATGRKKTDLTARTLEALAAEWASPVEAFLLPSDEQIEGVTGDCPAAFPLTWTCRRLKESAHSSAWKDEFATKTGVSATLSLSPTALASQVFHERIAQRLLEQLLEE